MKEEGAYHANKERAQNSDWFVRPIDTSKGGFASIDAIERRALALDVHTENYQVRPNVQGV